eukprot:2139268-Pyramimonas_sp.AAC.1
MLRDQRQRLSGSSLSSMVPPPPPPPVSESQCFRPWFEPTSARRGKLCFCTEVPEHVRRPYILSGYRPQQKEPASLLGFVLRELAYLHNET